MAWLDDLATVIVNAGVTTLANIRYSSRSSVPGGAGPYITMITTGGSGASGTHDDPLAYRFPGAQILTRASSHQAARDTALAALLALGRVRNQSINGVFYRAITPLQSEPFDLGLDDTNERIIMAFNVLGDRRS